MDLGQQIGANLKQLRTERGLTLGQLSSLAGISKAMLSELEKGNANPTINTLWKIANGLKVPYTRLMEGAEPTATLVRREEVLAQPQEYIYLLQGELAVETGGETYLLSPGDALSFDSTVAHTYRNRGETLVTGLVINYYHPS